MLDELRSRLACPVLGPLDAGYGEQVAGFDLGLVHRPDAVALPERAEDVCAAVRLAVEAGVPVHVLGSGHADVPPVTAGLMISARRLDSVRLDAGSRTAVIGAGCTWHDVLEVATPVGLAPVCGSAPAVGVGGFLLGGGLGPLCRTYGFSTDHVRAFELVGADGELRTVTPGDELFFALRGGKGGFGVVVSATVELPELPSFYGGGGFYAAEDIPAVLHAFRRFTNDDVPDELSVSVAILRLPDAAPIPLHGQTVAHLRMAYAGPPAEAEALLAPLRIGPPLLGAATELAYADIGKVHGDPTIPSAHSTGGMLLHALERETVDALMAVAGPAVHAPLAIVELRHLGGAVRRPPPERDAVSGRDAAYGLWVSSPPAPARDPAAGAAVRGVLDAVAPWSTGAVQINFCGSENTAEEAARAWAPDVAAELAAIRRRIDPAGVFAFTPGS